MRLRNLLVTATAKIECPACKYSLTSADLARSASQMNAGVLVCPKCMKVINANVGTFFHSSRISKENIKAVERFEVGEQNGTLHISIPWRHEASPWFILFGAVFFGTLVTVVQLTDGSWSWSFLDSFTTFHPTSIAEVCAALAAMLALVAAISNLINKTYITVTAHELKFRSGPVSLSPHRTIPTGKIKNLAVYQETRDGVNHNRVIVIFKDDESVNLCSTRNLNESLFIENLIEGFLKIDDDRTLDVVGIVTSR